MKIYFHILSIFNVNEMGSHWVLFLLYLNIVLNWPEDGPLRPKHVAKYSLIVITSSCLDRRVCCVLTLRNILYKFDNTQQDGLSKKKFKGTRLRMKFPASYGIWRHIIIFKTHVSGPHSDLPKLCPQLYIVLKIKFNPLKTEIHLNNIQKLSFHLTENTFFITKTNHQMLFR